MATGKATVYSLPSAKPEFTALSEEDVRRIIEADIECETPVTAEVNRFVAEYMQAYLDCVKRNGPVPGQVMFVRAEWPIERVAVALMIESLKGDHPGQGSVRVH